VGAYPPAFSKTRASPSARSSWHRTPSLQLAAYFGGVHSVDRQQQRFAKNGILHPLRLGFHGGHAAAARQKGEVHGAGNGGRGVARGPEEQAAAAAGGAPKIGRRGTGGHRAEGSAEDDQKGRPLRQIGDSPSFEQQAAEDSGERDNWSCNGRDVDFSMRHF